VLRFFRINDPYRLLGVLIILLLISLPLMIDPVALTLSELKARILGEAFTEGKKIYIQVYDNTPPLAATFYGIMNWLFDRSVTGWHVMAFIFIFFQAAYFGIMLINNKAYTDNTYLPALIYGVLAFFSFDLFSFSADLLASTFLLFTINNLFKEIEFKIQRDETVLNIGFTIGIASLLVFAYAAFLFAVGFMMVIFARASFRKILLMVCGFIIPHTILILLYFYRDNLSLLWQNFYLPSIYFSKHSLISFKSMVILAIIPAAYFLFSLVMLNRVARFTRYQSQLLQVMFIWIAPCGILLMLTPQLTPGSFYVFLPPFAYFICHYLLLIRRKWIAETMLWLFLLGIPAVSLMARYNKIKGVNYAALFPEEKPPIAFGKKVMVLGDNATIYQNNFLAGYFLNWDLSRVVFEEPDYYEHLTTINQSFENDPPDLILDERNLMMPVFERIPKLKKQYRREGNLYRRVGMNANKISN
jgi:hypothetical protein